MRERRDDTIKRFSKFNKKCRFCRMGTKELDYKDLPTLQKLTGSQGKLFSRKRSGNCARHQRSTISALKRARFLALLPYSA
ncbi:MAG: 30S ribosomal protein S18 [Planctomycetes bacterium RIFCSPHIGHO2_12_FULL_52_36]|nr:MAG: 30S ribosomal protein S18 [Planctomycetes bacterium RIFCSPHIGHO2_02_FULL_52_58]OHB93889.1 MAG: 30S ribosomal protein S18 [Planctomycetes bacterium RIFCSPHIGHO2_12_FULL_52_36]